MNIIEHDTASYSHLKILFPNNLEYREITINDTINITFKTKNEFDWKNLIPKKKDADEEVLFEDFEWKILSIDTENSSYLVFIKKKIGIVMVKLVGSIHFEEYRLIKSSRRYSETEIKKLYKFPESFTRKMDNAVGGRHLRLS